MGLRVLYVTLTFALLGALFTAPIRAAEAQSAEAYYRSVLAHMMRLPQPPLVSYDVVVRAAGATFYVVREPGSGEAEFGFSIGSALGDTEAWWPAFVRTSDGTTAVRLNDRFAVTRFPALNATWSGIDSWMRFGMQESPLPTPSPSSPPPLASPGSNEPPVIAVVRSLGLSIYRVSEGGPATCEGGAPGRLLHLSPRSDAAGHPATDVTVDTSTATICTIRFRIEHSELVDRDGYVELHVAPIGGYYLVNHGEIAFTAGPKLGRKHVRLFLDYARVAFPLTAPAGTFATPAPDGGA